MNTRQIDEYVRRLMRRFRYLEKSIASADEEQSHYMRAELMALGWAIDYVKDTSLEAAEHQNKWFNERIKGDV